MLAIDEAHCISAWGYDFRPAYLEIALFKKHLPNVPTIAVTATATVAVQADIQDKLGMKQARLLKKSFARSNLAYVVRPTSNKERSLLGILKKVSGSAVVYVKTRMTAERMAMFLQAKGVSADYYHAGLNARTREQRQKSWVHEARRVIVATNAFGMGIDKPNVRLVIHIDPPMSLEAYYQEAGRAGRDEKKAYAVLLYGEEDLDWITQQVRDSFLPIEYLKRLYQLLANYYQIAVGSHAGVSYEFDLDHFSTIYDLSAKKAQEGIKRLEAAGLVYFDDSLLVPAKVHIKLQGRDLYGFQVANPKADKLIRTILKQYSTDIFYSFQPISLPLLAHISRETTKEIDKQLVHLADLGVINYSPSGKHAKITFLTPRYAVDNLPLHEKKYLTRQAILTKKVEAMVSYIRHQHRCRTQLLLEYFGEISYKPCKVCDVCLSKRPKKSYK